jgi:hypothetical protein
MSFKYTHSVDDRPIYKCLSTDIKPLYVLPGAYVYETDTGSEFEFYGGATQASWVLR